MELIETCLQRSGALPLNIVVTVPLPEAEHEQFYFNIKHDIFMAAITEHAANRCRWLCFHYVLRPSCDWRLRQYRIDANLWVGDGVFPNLEGIYIRFPMFSRSFNNGHWSPPIPGYTFSLPETERIVSPGFNSISNERLPRLS